MSDYHSQSRYAPADAARADVDTGLRKFMLGVYGKMALGLVWSAVLAYAVGAYAPITNLVFGTPLVYLVQWGPLVLLLGSNFLMRNPSPTSSGLLYWSVVTLMGAGLGVWVYLALAQTGVTTSAGQTLNVSFGNITKAFLITAGAFGALSLWGYTTKRNLSGLHSFLVMATFGLVVISMLNAFLFHSPMFEVIMQVVVLGVFSLLVATQTQMLTRIYYHMQGDHRGLATMTNFGALNLYIAFITIFQMILSLMSSRN